MQAIAEKARDFFLLPWSEQLLRTRTNGFVSATDYDELYNELKQSNYDATSKLIGKLSKKQKLVLKLDYQEEIIAMENGQTTLVSKYKAKERASRMEHCSYRHSDFYDLITL